MTQKMLGIIFRKCKIEMELNGLPEIYLNWDTSILFEEKLFGVNRFLIFLRESLEVFGFS